MSKRKQGSLSPRILNRQARHSFHVLETLEVGIALTGSEVKSVRSGQVSLGEGFARVEPVGRQLFLYKVHIAPYSHAAASNGHDPQRTRKLLAHKRQIAHLLAQTSNKGTTMVPLAMYFVRGRVKVELGVVQGKRSHDKREDLKDREAKREMQRRMTRKYLA